MSILEQPFLVDSTLPDFSEKDEVSALVAYELVSPIARLMFTRNEILMANGIGALDHKKAVEQLLSDLSILERALYTRWQEL
jgi:hypothetical protein